MPLRRAALLVALVALVFLGWPVAAATPAGAATPVRSVYAAGTAPYLGSPEGLTLNGPLVDIVGTTTGKGYWLLGSDGGAFTYGDAPFLGSTGDIRLNRPVLSLAPTSSGQGYWFVASDGGIFAFGDAGFFGSAGDIVLNRPIVGMAPTPSGAGYFLIASDGGVFAFGDAGFAGSLGNQVLDDPIVALTPRPDGTGYWVLARDGEVFTFGAAPRLGWRADTHDRAIDIRTTPTGLGYWVLRQSGRVEAWGDAARLQPAVELGAGQRAVGLATTPDGKGVWVATSGAHRLSTSTATGPHAFLSTDRAGRPPRWNPCSPITWLFNPVGAPAGAETLLIDAFAHVAAVTGLPLRYGGQTAATPSAIYTDTIVVGWVPGIGAAGIGAPRWVFTPNGPRIFAAAILLEGTLAVPMTWGGDGWGAIVLHEIGHVVGLDHVEDVDQLMYPVVAGVHGFSPGDLAGLHRLGSAAGCL